MREYIIRLSILLAAIAALWACTETMKSYSHAVKAPPASELSFPARDMMLELPEIPRTMSRPEHKAGFIAIHFWDKLDFSDRRLTLNRRFMEQNFVHYLSLLPAVMSSDRVRAFESMFSRAASAPETFGLMKALGKKYLDDPRSPMVNGEYYSDFVRASQRIGL